MNLRRVAPEERVDGLYTYWKKAMEGVPYRFDTSLEAWTRCLFADSAAGESLFLDSQVWAAECEGEVAGFVQFGRPAFHYDGQGRRYRDPDIGVLRQLYFDRERPEAGAALMELAEAYLRRYPEAFAFYHAFGMGCQAYHGKLHERIRHVDGLLREHGFAVRHENVYYVVPVECWKVAPDRGMDVRVQRNDHEGTEEFSLYVDERAIGSASVRYLADLTGGRTRNIAYLTWIGIVGDARRRGFGRALISHIVERLGQLGCSELHTDTALTNVAAQAFYERLGFRNAGITRDYVRSAGTS